MAADPWPEMTTPMASLTGKLAVEEVTAILKSVGLRWTTNEAREMMSEVAIARDQLIQILRRQTHQEDEDQTAEQTFRNIQYLMLSLGEDFDTEYAERMLNAAIGGITARSMTLKDYNRTLKSKSANATQSS
jgi:Ca2+-binding EF-hand superfamily protein